MLDGPVPVNIGNICGGSVDERFGRELAEVMKNIADLNTNPTAKRKITLEFVITPGHTREVAEVEFRCTSKLAPASSQKSNMFISKRMGSVQAYARDPRQEEMFRNEKPASPGAQ